MEIDPKDLNARQNYGLLISCVVPRPIAWLSTQSVAGVRNLAPFSFFGGVTATPPTVMVSIGRVPAEDEAQQSAATRAKDSAQNLLDTGEGVIHIPHRDLAQPMVKTGTLHH